MSIITLLTDFGYKDHFVAKIKGQIYKKSSDIVDKVNIVDISHEVSPFNIMEAAYILQSSFNNFPNGTIHIIDVDSEKNIENSHIVMVFDSHYFICADNGILSILSQNRKAESIFEINISKPEINNESSIDIFTDVACHIANGGKLGIIGREVNEIKSLKNLVPFVNKESNQIICSIIYIDNFGNVITNLDRTLFNNISKGRNFEISARNYNFNKIYKKYSDIVNFDLPDSERNDEGKGLVIFNSNDNLQISIYKSNRESVGTASSLMGLKLYDTVTVSFK